MQVMIDESIVVKGIRLIQLLLSYSKFFGKSSYSSYTDSIKSSTGAADKRFCLMYSLSLVLDLCVQFYNSFLASQLPSNSQIGHFLYLGPEFNAPTHLSRQDDLCLWLDTPLMLSGCLLLSSIAECAHLQQCSFVENACVKPLNIIGRNAVKLNNAPHAQVH